MTRKVETKSTRPARKRLPVQNVEAFADFLTREMERQGVSSYEIERRALEGGYQIDHTTVWRVSSGKTPEVTSSTLTALSAALKVPVAKMREVLESNFIKIESAPLEILLHPDILEQLKAEARAHHRDASGEAAAILTSYFGGEVNIESDRITKTRGTVSRKTQLRSVK